MRHWLLILMIALLPLRSWVGDAMAVDMLAQPAHAAPAMDGHGQTHTDRHADHHAGHHAVNQAVCACAEQAATHDGADHQHNACDVCNVPALAMALPELQTSQAIHSPLAPPAERFASSEVQRGIKPPIS